MLSRKGAQHTRQNQDVERRTSEAEEGGVQSDKEDGTRSTGGPSSAEERRRDSDVA